MLPTEKDKSTYEIYTHTFDRIAVEIEEFFKENFNGALIFENELNKNGKTHFSHTATAIFIKRLFELVFSPTMLKVKIANTDDDLELKITWKKDAKIDENDKLGLTRLAQSMNLSLYFESFSAILVYKNVDVPMLSFYAGTRKIIKEALASAFLNL